MTIPQNTQLRVIRKPRQHKDENVTIFRLSINKKVDEEQPIEVV
jgi:hypothetical protein